jgi:uncharacterized Zn finger protein
MTVYTTLPERRNVVRLKRLQRESRMLEVVQLSTTPATYQVRSASQPDRRYFVLIDPATLSGQCTCPWAQYGGVNCKHVLAVLRKHYANQGEISFWATPQDALRQHRPIIAGAHLYATVRRTSTNEHIAG